MPFHSRPKESSLPSILLDVLVFDSINWLASIRLQEFLQVESFFKEMESDNYRAHLISSNDNNGYVEIEGSNECNESIEKANFSSKCEEMHSNTNESNDSSKHEKNGYESKNEDSCSRKWLGTLRYHDAIMVGRK